MNALYVYMTLSFFAFLSFKTGKLNLSGALTGFLTSCIIYLASGFSGLVLLAGFFVLGTAATYFKFEKKQQLNVNESKSGRTASQVLANAGVAALLSLILLVFPENKELFILMIAANFASATSDTLSSELGNVYGSNFYNILSLKKDIKGLDGVVSLEGTLFGLAGAVLISTLFILTNGWSMYFYYIIIAGMLGNLCDSVLGATFERRRILNNNLVNFGNTAFAALVVMMIYFVEKHYV